MIGGTFVPYFITEMITKQLIADLVNEKLEDGMFPVDIEVNAENLIQVEVDSDLGITIDQCVAISRHIESHLNREEEDFELRVSSPGIDQPFKVVRQYRKNVGRELDVLTLSNAAFCGKLTEADDEGFRLEVMQRESVEGKKKKELVRRTHSFRYEEIKKAKIVISFK